MGGCFSSSGNLQLHATPVYYYYPPVSEEHASSPPPTPIPYNVVLAGPQSSWIDLKEANCRNKLDINPKKVQLVELLKSDSLTVSATDDEEDVCPTCLEEYDSENPKINTKCNHHFHLSCILEWMERSDTCPICDQEMIYECPFPSRS